MNLEEFIQVVDELKEGVQQCFDLIVEGDDSE
jgi:hypothetical protein